MSIPIIERTFTSLNFDFPHCLEVLILIVCPHVHINSNEQYNPKQKHRKHKAPFWGREENEKIILI